MGQNHLNKLHTWYFPYSIASAVFRRVHYPLHIPNAIIPPVQDAPQTKWKASSGRNIFIVKRIRMKTSEWIEREKRHRGNRNYGIRQKKTIHHLLLSLIDIFFQIDIILVRISLSVCTPRIHWLLGKYRDKGLCVCRSLLAPMDLGKKRTSKSKYFAFKWQKNVVKTQ